MPNESESQSHKILNDFLTTTHCPNDHQDVDANPPASPPAYSYVYPNAGDPEEVEFDFEGPPPSPLKIHISIPLHISGSSNLVILPSPDVTARSIAQAVLKALRIGVIRGEDALPLIDENGYLRPVEVSVEAGVKVEGRGNVIGDGMQGVEGLRRVVGELRGGGARKGGAGPMDGGRGRGMVNVGHELGGMRRASSAPVDEARDCKRRRSA